MQCFIMNMFDSFWTGLCGSRILFQFVQGKFTSNSIKIGSNARFDTANVSMIIERTRIAIHQIDWADINSYIISVTYGLSQYFSISVSDITMEKIRFYKKPWTNPNIYISNLYMGESRKQLAMKSTQMLFEALVIIIFMGVEFGLFRKY